MLAYYGDRISPHMTESPEGYLICHDVPIARTGPQEYLARELGLEGDPERLVLVDRLPEDVFEPAALASFEGKPVTDNHPPESVGPENFGAYARGHVQNVRRRGDYLVADLYLNDAALAGQVKSGAMREVSCGYTCDYVPVGEGFRQTRIRGNHVAVVPRGRAGRSVAIKDTAPQAEKGQNVMKDFRKRLLALFGQAAKDASPEELEAMAQTTADALDAEPAEQAQEAGPVQGDAAPAADEAAEKASPEDALAGKLERILQLLEAQAPQEEPALHDEGDLDSAVEELSGEKDPEAAVTVPAERLEDGCMEGPARDAALELLKRVRPAVASIPDKAAKARVVDALLQSIRSPQVMGEIARAAESSAKKAAQDAASASYEQLCRESEQGYAARNPHKNNQ